MAYILRYADTPCLHALIGDIVGSRCTVILGARHCFVSTRAKVNTVYICCCCLRDCKLWTRDFLTRCR